MHRQRGITFIGWLVLLTPFAVVLYAAIRLTPVYLNYLKVSHTLDEVATQFHGGGANATNIEEAVSRHFEIESVDYPTVHDVAISRSAGGWKVEAAYYDYAPLFAHISLQIAFDKSVTVSGG